MKELLSSLWPNSMPIFMFLGLQSDQASPTLWILEFSRKHRREKLMRYLESTIRTFGAAAAVTAMLAMPALAQTSAPNSMSSNTMVNGTGTNNSNSNTGPSGTLNKTHGYWRAGAIDGAAVYNTDGQKIGTIDNLLLNSSGTAQKVIISVGGFLGVGDKLVEVPFSQISFKPSTGNDNSANTPKDYSIVLKTATKKWLNSAPSFSYDANKS